MNEILKWVLSVLLGLALLRFAWEAFDYWRREKAAASATPAPIKTPWRPDTHSAITNARSHLPVAVHYLAETIGLEVKRVPMHESVAGELVHTGSGNYACILNSMHKPLQQRFTLAHQIGHYVLHRDVLGNGISDSDQYKYVPGSKYRNSQISERDEIDATKFARWLLMPAEHLERFKFWDLTVDRMAENFEVEPEIVAAELYKKPETVTEDLDDW